MLNGLEELVNLKQLTTDDEVYDDKIITYLNLNLKVRQLLQMANSLFNKKVS